MLFRIDGSKSINALQYNLGCIFLFFLLHSGESYGGIYVPTLVNTIRIMNEKVTTSQQINLKGFMVYMTLKNLLEVFTDFKKGIVEFVFARALFSGSEGGSPWVGKN